MADAKPWKGQGSKDFGYTLGFGTLGSIRTEAQVPLHKGFAPGALFVRREVKPETDASPTMKLAKPPAWTSPDLPCVGKWGTEEYDTTLYSRRLTGPSEDTLADAWCRQADGEKCPARAACLEAAMREEQGLHHQWRHLVRGGLTPRARWELEQQEKESAA